VGSLDAEEVPMSVFKPTSLTIAELGTANPFHWKVAQELTYTADDSSTHQAEKGFTTDLASVPLIMTWLIPRYGHYTKAAVIHDKRCRDQNFDRFVADELFEEAMGTLGVPWLRRLLMAGAVTWPTMIGHLVRHKLGGWLAIVGTILTTLILSAFMSGWALVAGGLGAALLWPGIATLITTSTSRWRAVGRCYLGMVAGSLFIIPALLLLPFLGLYLFIENPQQAIWRVADWAKRVLIVFNHLLPDAMKAGVPAVELPAATTPRDQRFRVLFGLDGSGRPSPSDQRG
jgi:MFS family permease